MVDKGWVAQTMNGRGKVMIDQKKSHGSRVADRCNMQHGSGSGTKSFPL